MTERPRHLSVVPEADSYLVQQYQALHIPDPDAPPPDLHSAKYQTLFRSLGIDIDEPDDQEE